MSSVIGNSNAVYVSDSGGAQRNLSSFLDGCDTSWDREVKDTSVYGTMARTKTGGLRSNSFSCTGKWDNGATATPDQWLIGLEQAAGTVTSTFYIFPHGSAAGKPYYTGLGFVTNYKTSIPYDDIVTFSFDFDVSGDVTRGTA